ncbi:MAG: uracil-DNA glycosylase family protein [Bacteroidales bacterium]|nr:uracil-DNA glycosylase family protein [Bacteroidales bacterium]
MADSIIEYHPLQPFLPPSAKVLMLGSFPPQQSRWSMNFYYPNLQNDMWRIMGLIFYSDSDHFLTDNKKAFDEKRIKSFCTEKGIAISDTAKAVIRQKDNASDKFLKIVEPIDLPLILNQLPVCHTIITTGQKATDSLREIIQAEEPKIGSYSAFTFFEKTLRIYRMPSTSRAYPKSLIYKASMYEAMFNTLTIK